MKTYEELLQEEEELEIRLDEVKKLLAMQPKNFATLFPFFAQENPVIIEWLVKYIEYIEAISGIFDFRKNEMEYKGFEFKIKGKTPMQYREGSNWCSNYTELCQPTTPPTQGREIQPDRLGDILYPILTESCSLEELENRIASVTDTELSTEKVISYVFNSELGAGF